MLTDLLHVLRFWGWSIPAVVEDKNIGTREPLIHFMEKGLFLKNKKQNTYLQFFKY